MEFHGRPKMPTSNISCKVAARRVSSRDTFTVAA